MILSSPSFQPETNVINIRILVCVYVCVYEKERVRERGIDGDIIGCSIVAPPTAC